MAQPGYATIKMLGAQSFDLVCLSMLNGLQQCVVFTDDFAVIARFHQVQHTETGIAVLVGLDQLPKLVFVGSGKPALMQATIQVIEGRGSRVWLGRKPAQGIVAGFQLIHLFRGTDRAEIQQPRRFLLRRAGKSAG